MEYIPLLCEKKFLRIDYAPGYKFFSLLLKLQFRKQIT